MKRFILHLQSATQYERLDDVTSFVGEDASGSFGILAGHARLTTSLVFGLARFRAAGQPWEYLALPSALLYFVDNELYINTRRYLRDRDYQRISAALQQELLKEEQKLHTVKEGLRRMEDEMLRRLWRLQRGAGERP